MPSALAGQGRGPACGGQVGLIERCEGWWQAQLSRHERDRAPGTPASDRPHPYRAALRRRRSASFRSGLDAYKRARTPMPTAAADAAERAAAARRPERTSSAPANVLTASISRPMRPSPTTTPAVARTRAHQLLDYDKPAARAGRAPTEAAGAVHGSSAALRTFMRIFVSPRRNGMPANAYGAAHTGTASLSSCPADARRAAVFYC
jgi:hypothetical protein